MEVSDLSNFCTQHPQSFFCTIGRHAVDQSPSNHMQSVLTQFGKQGRAHNEGHRKIAEMMIGTARCQTTTAYENL